MDGRDVKGGGTEDEFDFDFFDFAMEILLFEMTIYEGMECRGPDPPRTAQRCGTPISGDIIRKNDYIHSQRFEL